ncbi:hypothetical protein HK099_001641 [Clydaea vesicula]|uniref:Uncharacterized protein n=1 Tax=Clydaea vesicula TaxID=447962 RepID=A0AAD5U6B5_9FUNG|nr:hypothetical protein HK099_001641 [Clydaea vesicula]
MNYNLLKNTDEKGGVGNSTKFVSLEKIDDLHQDDVEKFDNQIQNMNNVKKFVSFNEKNFTMVAPPRTTSSLLLQNNIGRTSISTQLSNNENEKVKLQAVEIDRLKSLIKLQSEKENSYIYAIEVLHDEIKRKDTTINNLKKVNLENNNNFLGTDDKFPYNIDNGKEDIQSELLWNQADVMNHLKSLLFTQSTKIKNTAKKSDLACLNAEEKDNLISKLQKNLNLMYFESEKLVSKINEMKLSQDLKTQELLNLIHEKDEMLKENEEMLNSLELNLELTVNESRQVEAEYKLKSELCEADYSDKLYFNSVQLEEKNAIIDDLNNSLESKETALKNLQFKIDDLQRNENNASKFLNEIEMIESGINEHKVKFIQELQEKDLALKYKEEKILELEESIRTVNDEKTRIKTSFELKLNEIKNFEEKIYKGYNDELSERELRLREKEDIIHAMKFELEDLQILFKATKEETVKLPEEKAVASNLQKIINETQEELKKLQLNYDIKKRELGEEVTKKEELALQVLKKEDDIKSLKKNLNIAVKDIEKSFDENIKLEKNFKLQQNEFDALRIKLESSCTVKTNELKAAQEKIEKLEKSLTAKSKELLLLEEHIETKDTESHKNIDDMTKAIKSSLQRKCEENTKLLTSLSICNEEKATLEEKLRKQKLQFHKEVVEKEEEHLKKSNDLNFALKTLKLALESEKQENHSNIEEYEVLSKATKSLKMEIEDLKVELNKKNTKISNFQLEKLKIEAMSLELGEKTLNLIKEKNILQEEINVFRSLEEKNKNIIEEWSKEIKKLRYEKESIKIKLENYTKANTDFSEINSDVLIKKGSIKLNEKLKL